MGGRYTEGVGGGVCQASTAVYNCALRAGLKITAVSRHSLVPTYVPPSFDAMVNGSGSDLKFVNDTGGPVSIRTVVSDGHARVEIWSSRMTYTVECRSVTLSVGERPADEEFIDTDRVYISGVSSGGYGTWAALVAEPDLFAAAMPLAPAYTCLLYTSPSPRD